MRIRALKFLVLYTAAWILVYSFGFFGLEPGMNFTALGIPFFAAYAGMWFSFKRAVAVFAAGIAGLVLMYYPLDKISAMIMALSIILLAAMFVISLPFSRYLKELVLKEEELKARQEVLNRVKKISIKQAQEQDDSVEKEIKEMVSLYGAVKEMSSSLQMDESLEIITEILKRAVKSNFRIPLDEVSMILLFKKGPEFQIANSFGHDEESLKENEKQVVSSILKNVAKKNDVIYIPDVSAVNKKSPAGIIGSVLYSPFFAEKKLLGVLCVSSPKKNLFSEKQIESIKILSSQIAIAMEKVHLYEEVSKMSITDSLTGLHVHRYFQEKIENELKRTSRYGENLSLVMCDIDLFKKINDTYGHLAGDYILKAIAIILKNSTTPVDTVARYGGEEFVIIMPNTDKNTGHMRAVKIRKEVENYKFMYKETSIKVTMSFGVAAYPGDAITRRSLIDKADKALYKAKEEGRNRVVKS